jgi:lysophospholipase-2
MMLSLLLLQKLLNLVILIVSMQRTVLAMASSSNNSKSGALIFLHGLGDSPGGWSHLQRSLPKLQPRLSDLEYVFPAAPTIPISINGGMSMSGWFDLYDWPIKVGAKDDPDGLAAGVETVEQHVKVLNDMGIPSDKIVVAGFSQGGAVALLTAYQSKTRYAGCVSLSGWLTLPDQLNVSDEAKKTPLYWGHGTYDDKVLFNQQPHGVAKLREQGVNVMAEVSL